MNNGIKFDAEFQRSRGNFLNLHEEKITRLIEQSDGRSPEQYAYQKSLRAKYLPEIPGYVPKNPIYRAELDRNLDYLIDLRVKAGNISRDAPFIAQFAIFKEIFKAAFNPIDSISSPISTTWKILTSYSDGLGEIESARVKMMREFYDQSYNYVVLSNKLYLAEKKDSTSWQVTEKYRADVSRNRLETFSLGDGYAGLHHEITLAVGNMEKVWRGEEERLKGATLRRFTGMFGDTFGLVLPVYLYGKSIKNKVSDYLL